MEVKKPGRDAVTTTAEKRGAIVLPNTTWTPADPEAYSGGQAAHVDHLKELEFAEKGDNGSRELLEGILKDEEEGIDWLEAQLHLVKEIGKERYLAEQIEGH